MTIDPRFHESIRDKLAELFGSDQAEALMSEWTLPSIDEQFAALQATLIARFDQVDARLADFGQRLEHVDLRLAGIDHRLEHIDHRLEALEGRVERLEGRADKTDAAFDRVHARLDEIHGRMTQMLMWVVGTVVLGLVGVGVAAVSIGG